MVLQLCLEWRGNDTRKKNQREGKILPWKASLLCYLAVAVLKEANLAACVFALIVFAAALLATVPLAAAVLAVKVLAAANRATLLGTLTLAVAFFALAYRATVFGVAAIALALLATASLGVMLRLRVVVFFPAVYFTPTSIGLIAR